MKYEIIADDLTYSAETIRDYIEDAVGNESRCQAHPRWYAITGSHLYGFSSPSSDIDIRGFHTAPANRYAGLNSPKGEISVNMGTTTEGYESMSEADLRSRELRSFTEQLVTANYNAIELALHAPVVMNGVPLEMDALRAIIREHLPLDVPHSYMGMAKSNYYNYLDPDKTEAYRPTPKKFCYVYRGLLGAQFTHDTGEIEPDLLTLAQEVDWGNEIMVHELIEDKRSPDFDSYREPVAEDYRHTIADGFRHLPEFESPDKESYRDDLDTWMTKIRGL